MKKLVSLLLALCLVFALGASAFAASFPASGFSDVSRSAWYAEAVDFVKASGLMNGVGNNRFDPSGTVTRAMVVTVLYRLADKPSVSGQSNPFRDVPNDAGCWYRDAAIWAVKNGVTNGDGSANVFSPNKAITREQMATMIVRYVKNSSLTISKIHSASQALACSICKVKNAPGLLAKSITISATISSAECLTPTCSIPADTGKRRKPSKRRSRLNWTSSVVSWSLSRGCGYWISAVDGAGSPSIWREITRSALSA